MKTIKSFKNIYGKSLARIERGYIAPYDDAKFKELAFRTVCEDKSGFVYHVSVFPSLEDAERDLENLAFAEV